MPKQSQPCARERPLILVVDDSVELGMVVRILCRRAGQDVTLCPNVAVGWQAVQERWPDLLLLDVNLPGPSGPELCRMIRATPALATMRVALFSHWQMPHDVIAGLEAGVDFVVSKDLITQADAWQARLREILAAAHGQHWQRLVSSSKNRVGTGLSSHWVDDLNRALRHPSLACLRPQVLRFLLRRGLRQGASSRIADPEIDAWLAPLMLF